MIRPASRLFPAALCALVVAATAIALPACELTPEVETPERVRECLDDPIDGDGLMKGGFYWTSPGVQPELIERCPVEGFICDPEDDTASRCMTTVADQDAPWAHRPCWMWRHDEKTTFPMDCRCQENFKLASPIRACVRPYRLVTESDPTPFGSGPHAYALGSFSEQRGGFVDAGARELVLVGRWRGGDDYEEPERAYYRGYVLAVHLDTGDRRIISGDYADAVGEEVKRGAGPGFREPWKVERGPDGRLYVFEYLGASDARIVRVDPATGDREIAWSTEQPDRFGWCHHGSKVPSHQQRKGELIHGGNPSFTMDSVGNFYLANDQGAYGSGVSIMRISPDGQGCEYLTRSAAAPDNDYGGNDIGGGPRISQGAYSALSIDGGQLWAVNAISLSLVRVDLATGDRRIVSSASSPTVGAGPTGDTGLGRVYTVQDPGDPNRLWAIGKDGGTVIVSVDKETGERTAHHRLPGGAVEQQERMNFWRGALSAGNTGSGGFWFDPGNPDIVFLGHDNWAIVRAELSTYNNYVHSL